MKARLRTVKDGDITYDALMFVCPGCIDGARPERENYFGIHLLPVNSEVKTPSWDWNGDLEKPTLKPSIKTQGYSLCHSYLTDGVFEFLNDSTHSLAGQHVPMPDLPDWAVELSDQED